jgi:UDPglucose--hexose-1-phosphate uridylyltransferase
MNRRGSALLSDVLDRELREDRRIVWSNPEWVILVPYWAVWPFETLVLPRRPVADLAALGDAERKGLAEAVGQLTRLYDRVFDTPFPYTMGLHQRPCQGPSDGFVLHLHAYPPLLRGATVRKHMVGFEMLAMAQRDLTAEAAAVRLRDCSKAVAPW